MREVARVEVDSKARVPVNRLQRAACRDEIIGDLRPMNLECEANALSVEDAEDGLPAVGKSLVPAKIP